MGSEPHYVDHRCLRKCLKSFKVSDKFAGRTGPGPNCKATLRVPTKAEEVTIHAPAAFAEGGRTKAGKLITKPIAWVRRQIVACGRRGHRRRRGVDVGGSVAGRPALKVFQNGLVLAVALLAVSLPVDDRRLRCFAR